MPRLKRRFGNALQEGGNSLQQLALKLYQKQLDDEQAKTRFEQQQTLAGDQQESSQLITLAQNPDVARRLSKAGQKFGRVDPTHFSPSDAELVGPLYETLSKITDRAALPGDMEIEGLVAGRGVEKDPRPIESLMAARNEREGRLSAEALRKIQEGERYDEASGRKVIGPAGAAVPLEATPGQAGANKQTELLAGELSKPVVDARVGQAGRTSYASSAASTKAPIDVEIGRLDDIAAIAEAKRDPFRDMTGAEGQTPDQNRLKMARSLFDNFKELSKKINSDEGLSQMGGGLVRRGKGMINLDNDAKLFRSLRDPLGVLMAVAAQGSRPTDRDAKVLTDLFPNETTPKEVAEAQLAIMEQIFNEAGLDSVDVAAVLAAPPGTKIPGVRPVGDVQSRLLLATRPKRPTTPPGARGRGAGPGVVLVPGPDGKLRLPGGGQ